MFNFELEQKVVITASSEEGRVNGRAEYTTGENTYLVHYKAADGRATSQWWNERDLHAHELGK